MLRSWDNVTFFHRCDLNKEQNECHKENVLGIGLKKSAHASQDITPCHHLVKALALTQFWDTEKQIKRIEEEDLQIETHGGMLTEEHHREQNATQTGQQTHGLHHPEIRFWHTFPQQPHTHCDKKKQSDEGKWRAKKTCQRESYRFFLRPIKGMRGSNQRTLFSILIADDGGLEILSERIGQELLRFGREILIGSDA